MEEAQLSPEQIMEVDEALRAGMPLKQALTAAGISKAQYRKYIKLADRGVEPYAAWVTSLAQAEWIGVKAHLMVIGESKDWRARAWLLERTKPQEYGQKVQLEVTRELEKVMSAFEKVLPQQWFDKCLDALACDEPGAGVEGEAQEPVADLN